MFGSCIMGSHPPVRAHLQKSSDLYTVMRTTIMGSARVTALRKEGENEIEKCHNPQVALVSGIAPKQHQMSLPQRQRKEFYGMVLRVP